VSLALSPTPPFQGEEEAKQAGWLVVVVSQQGDGDRKKRTSRAAAKEAEQKLKNASGA
jgi:hypothetical protein